MRLMHLPPGSCRVFYLRREQTVPSTSSFERLYEDEMMQIDEEVKTKGKAREESHYLPDENKGEKKEEKEKQSMIEEREEKKDEPKCEQKEEKMVEETQKLS